MTEAYKILNRDPLMKKVIRKTGKLEPSAARDPYRSLLDSIMSQQLSTKAADTIIGRFYQLFPRKNPRPSLLIETPVELLRSAGLSGSKSQYVKNVAHFALEGNLKPTLLNKLNDEELIIHLMTIKGVGRWTAEILAMFALQRDDMFPIDDLGIRNGISSIYGLNTSHKTFLKKATLTSEAWRPYRSLACRHLWRWRDS